MRDLWSIFILGQTQEMEWDIDNEEGRAHILDLKDKIVANVEGDGSEVHRWEARVDDDDEHDTVPEIQERALCVKLHSIFAAYPFIFHCLVLNRLQLTTTLGANFLLLYVNSASFRLVLLTILALKQLFLHVFGAIDQHRFSVFLSLFLLAQVFNDWCLKERFGYSALWVATHSSRQSCRSNQ